MTKKTRLIAILFILVVFGVIAAIGLYQNQAQSKEWTAQEYFQVTEAGVINGEVDGDVWILYGISVTFKAVGGDAHGVVVQSWAGSEAQEIGTMVKDVPQTIWLYSPTSTYGGGYASHKNQTDGHFYVEIRITSLETGTGKIKFPLSG
jgi:hypothetical protein